MYLWPRFNVPLGSFGALIANTSFAMNDNEPTTAGIYTSRCLGLLFFSHMKYIKCFVAPEAVKCQCLYYPGCGYLEIGIRLCSGWFPSMTICFRVTAHLETSAPNYQNTLFLTCSLLETAGVASTL